MTPMRTPMESLADRTDVTEDKPHAWLDGRLSDEQRHAPKYANRSRWRPRSRNTWTSGCPSAWAAH